MFHLHIISSYASLLAKHPLRVRKCGMTLYKELLDL